MVVFNELNEENYEKIAALMLGELKEPLNEKGIRLSWTDEVCAYLAKKSNSGVRGARELRNVIRREIEDKIADIIIDNSDENISGISVETKDDTLEIKYI